MLIGPTENPHRFDRAEQILRACRGGSGFGRFRTPGDWGMRTSVLLSGFGSTERTACVVLDLSHSLPHPTKFGFTVPIVLACGPTWEAVYVALAVRGEL